MIVLFSIDNLRYHLYSHDPGVAAALLLLSLRRAAAPAAGDLIHRY